MLLFLLFLLIISLLITSSSDIIGYIVKLGGQSNTIRAQLVSFQSRIGLYAAEDLEKEPIIYWNRLSKYKATAALAGIALRILGFPQSSASVERSFSAVRQIHTLHRNRLGRKKLAKLVYLFFNERSLKKYYGIDSENWNI